MPVVDRPQQQMEMTRSGVYSVNERDHMYRGAPTPAHATSNAVVAEKSTSGEGSGNGGVTVLQVITASGTQQPARSSGSAVDGSIGRSEQREAESEPAGEAIGSTRPTQLQQLQIPTHNGEATTTQPSPSPSSHSMSSQPAVDEHKQPIESQAKAETVINHQSSTLPEPQRNPAVLLPPLTITASQPHSALSAPPSSSFSSSSSSSASPRLVSSSPDIPSPVPEEAGSPPDSSPLSVDHAPAWHSEPDDSPGRAESSDDEDEPGERMAAAQYRPAIPPRPASDRAVRAICV